MCGSEAGRAKSEGRSGELGKARPDSQGEGRWPGAR